MAIHRYNTGIAVSSLVFVLIFISQKTALVSLAGDGHGGQFGLLLFILPGILGALLAGNNKLVYPSLAAAFCWLLFNICVTTGYSLWHQLTYLLSAVFWCGFGALGCCFAGMRCTIRRIKAPDATTAWRRRPTGPKHPQAGGSRRQDGYRLRFSLA
ncbi:MAG: inner membrane protein YbjM [Sodalis sp. (in: enterobacteria)]|uniref:inner membrane protein YbjM n=1 Tax=Sodalis sp. (in: enterobacteria) TaxID=1898979 RepID=UPI0039E4FBA5